VSTRGRVKSDDDEASNEFFVNNDTTESPLDSDRKNPFNTDTRGQDPATTMSHTYLSPRSRMIKKVHSS